MKSPVLFLFTLTLFLICSVVHAQQTIFINEIMASNDTTIADANGEYDDWFEIYNADAAPFSLTNYYVTDDTTEPTKFQFTGNVTVPANGYLIIWASGKNSDSIHLPFKISASGEGIYLYQPDGTTLIDSVSFGLQKTDISYGRVTDGTATFGYFKNPTPGASNNTSQTYLGFLQAPVFSADAGFYANPFQLTITDADADAEIIYTTNGSNPNANNLNGEVYRYKNHYPQAHQSPSAFLYDSFKSNLYSQPLPIIDATNNPNRLCLKSSTTDKTGTYYPVTNINKATLVRAIAVKDGYISSPETAATYFVTPNGINHYKLPVISLGIQEDYMFNWDSGIYCAGVDYENWRASNLNANKNNGTPANYQRETEYPLSIEFFEDSSTVRKFYNSAGFQVHGGYSQALPQKSLNIYFRGEYGSADLDYKLFPNLPYTNYQRFALRCSGQDETSTRIRDMAIQASISHLKFDTQASRPSIVFIDGEYTGLLNIRTKYDKYYFEQVYGINEDDLDFLYNNARINDGDSLDYLALRSFIFNNSMTNATNYDSVKKRMDVDNYIDYYISKIYFGVTDWPQNNIAYFRKRVPYTPDAPYGQDGRYRWINEDNDSGLGRGDSVTDNTLNLAVGKRTDRPKPSWSTKMFSQLTKNTNFRNSFVNRYCDLLNTSFLPARVISVITYFHDLIAPEMPECMARWVQSPESLTEWNNNVNAMDTFAAQRPPYAFQQLQDFWSLSAKQQITLNVSDTSGGFVHINTIDVTPAFPGVPQNAYPWSGYYFPNVPITIIAVPKPGYHFLQWQGDDNSTNDSLSFSLASAKSFTAVFEKDAVVAEDIIDYWHFDSLPQPPVVLASVNADSTATGNAIITYEGSGAGYMDYTDTASTGYPFGTQEGSDINSQLDETPGNALRVRNPSNTRYLLIKAPTTSFQNIKIKYATVRTNKGAQYQRVSYTTDGSTWIVKQDSVTMPFPETVPFALDSMNFSNDANVNNNSLFAVKIEFFGSQATGSSGNNRFDNLTVSGIKNSCGIPSGLTATNITANSASVSWNAVYTANNYDVDYKADTAAAWISAAVATTSLTVNLSGLSPNILYDYRVRSNCSTGSSEYVAAQFSTNNIASCNSIYDGTTHNNFAGAVQIPLNTDVNGTISSATDTDYYAFTISHRGSATVTLSTLPANYDFYVYNSKFAQYSASKNTGTTTETKTTVYNKGIYYVKIIGVNGAFDAINCYTLNVSPVTANLESLRIKPEIANNTLHLFPNPVSSVLNVNTSTANSRAIIKVISVFGQTVLLQQVVSPVTKIDVSKLANSTYLLIIENKNGSIISTSKFVKQ